MLIFHVLMVMRLLGREGASGQRGGFRTVYGASRLSTRLHIYLDGGEKKRHKYVLQ